MQITEDKLQWENPVDGYQYRIRSSDDAPEGDAQIIFIYVHDTLAEVQLVLLSHGLRPEDKIVQLNTFYPNGRGLNEITGEHMRRGVGTVMLDPLYCQSPF